MSSKIKKMCIVGLALFIIGAVISTGIYFLYNGPLDLQFTNGRWISSSSKNAMLERFTVEEDLANYTNLDLSVEFTKVTFIPSDKYRVEFSGVGSAKDVVSKQSGNSYTFSYKAPRSIVSFNIPRGFDQQINDNTLKLYYPEATPPTIIKGKFAHSSGNIEGMKLSDITLNVRFGDMKLKDIDTEKLDVDLAHTDFSCETIKTDSLIYKGKFGDTNFEDITVNGALNVTATQGDIKIKGLTADSSNFDIEFTTIKGRDVFLKNTRVEAKHGEIDLQGDLTGSSSIKVSFTDVDLLLQGTEKDYDLDIDVDFGEIRIGKNSYEGKIKQNYSAKESIIIFGSHSDTKMTFQK